jgi:hypothetical protein
MCLTLRHVGYVEARVARLNPKNERSPIVAALHLTMRNLAVGAAGRGQQHVLLVIWNRSSPHYRRALGVFKGERLWRMQVGEVGRSHRWC